MATTFTDQYNQQLQQVQSQLQAAQKNAAGGWGGSADDMRHWQDVANTYANQYTALKQIGPAIQQIDAQGLGSDPNMQSLIQQMLSAPDSANAALLQQSVTQNSQLASQQQQLQGLQSSIQAQDFGSPTSAESAAGQGANISDALTNNQGLLGQLNQFESGQTQNMFSLESPSIRMALGGQGLQNSGANVELQSKALANLQLQQQQSIMNAGMGMQSNLQGLQQQSTLGNIGTQQQNQANLQQTQNFYTTMAFQQQLMQQQASLAQQLSQYGGSSGGILGGISGAIGGGLAGFALGGPVGGALGAIGGGVGGGLSQSGVGQGIGSLGSAFFAANQPKQINSYQQF